MLVNDQKGIESQSHFGCNVWYKMRMCRFVLIYYGFITVNETTKQRESETRVPRFEQPDQISSK